MGMAAILFNGAEPFEQIVNTPLKRRSYVKCGENLSIVSDKKTFKNYTILYMYIALGQGQINPRGAGL